MNYYPVNLDINGRNCLVVGGGSVGTRKAQTLLNCGARVTVVSPEISDDLARLDRNGRLSIQKRAFEPSDLQDKFLVIGATDDEALNRRIHQEAESRNMLCNIADRPEACNFILPAILKRGDLIIAVSTSGKSPAFAKRLRREMEKQFGPEYETFLALMGQIRRHLLKERHAPEAHKPLFEELISGDLLECIRQGNVQGVNAALKDVLGPGYDFEQLLQEARRGNR